MTDLEKLHLSFRAGHYMRRWRKIQLELFTPNLPAERQRRIREILHRLITRYNQLTPWGNQINLG